MTDMNRRDFIGGAAAAIGACAVGGCAIRPKNGCGSYGRVPYGETIGDRLWMWGHHRDSFKALKGRKEQYNLPYDTRIDMAAACREMNVPGCFVVRWTNNPTAAELPEYMRQFENLRRVGFSITDSACESFEEKVRLGFQYADKMPNLTTLIMDDFWGVKTFTRPVAEIFALKERMVRRNLKLSVVLYSDRKEINPEAKAVLDVCDEVTMWVWSGENTGTIAEQVDSLRDLVGDEKPLLLGQYMWDFGGRRPMPGVVMERQLRQTQSLLDDGAVSGVIFHCTPLVDMDLDAVRISKAWIAANAERRWAAGR